MLFLFFISLSNLMDILFICTVIMTSFFAITLTNDCIAVCRIDVEVDKYGNSLFYHRDQKHHSYKKDGRLLRGSSINQ